MEPVVACIALPALELWVESPDEYIGFMVYSGYS